MTSSSLERLNIDGYNVTASFGRNKCRGGGVVILTKPSINCKEIILPEIQNLISEKIFECCLVELDKIIPRKKILIIGCYRNPIKQNELEFIERLNTMFEIINFKYKHVVFMGDINIDMLRVNDNNSKKLLHVVTANGFQSLVDFPTRITESTETAIDNVFTNLNRNYYKIIGVNTQLSDHDGQILEIVVDTKNKLYNSSYVYLQYKRNFNDKNVQQLIYALGCESWWNLYLSPVECKYEAFYEVFMHYFNEFFPLTLSRQHTNRKWISNELKLEKQKIINLNKAARELNCKELLNKARKSHKQFRKKLYCSKKQYYKTKICNADNVNRASWNIINSEVGAKTVKFQNINLKINNDVCFDPSLVCENFIDYFSDVIDDTVIPNLYPSQHYFDYNQDFELPLTKSSFTFRLVDEKIIDDIIKGLKNSYSAGYDGIPVVLLKRARAVLLKPITHLINSSLISGIFPSKLKITKLKPLFKKGDRQIVSNYRPIALLPSLSKIYEKVVYNQLVCFFEENHIFDDCQHGFRSSRSVITAATDFIESIIDSLDNKSKVVGLFMDLSKAFDSISHDLLLLKLSKIGIQNNALNWLKSYILDRKQFVELIYCSNKNYKIPYNSCVRDVKYGVPQGSILGPLLFIFYLRNFPKLSILSKLCLYADDTNLKITAETYNELEIKANSDMYLLNTFFNSNNLLLNPDKTNFISFQTRQTKSKIQPKITVNNKIIQSKDTIKFLGLEIDKNLNWNYHVNQLLSKISSGLYALTRLKPLCEKETLKMIYFSYIHSIIYFGISLYGATNQQNLQLILKMQKKAIRILCNLKPRTSAKEHFKSENIMTVYGMYVFETILSIKDRLNEMERIGDNHNYSTRNRENLATCSHNLQLFEKKPKYAGSKFYNKLPKEIQVEVSKSKFKSKLKTFLINKAMYSFEEL